MKKTILFTILLLLMPFCVNAQKMTLAMLKNYTWRLEVPDFHGLQAHEITIVKDSLQYMVYFKHSGHRYYLNRMYYFTDTAPSKFDKTKIGKANSGKYLVLAPKEMDFFFYYEYVKLEGDRLYLKREFGEDWIFRRVPKGVTSGGGQR